MVKEKWNILQWSSQSLIEQAFHLLKTKLKAQTTTTEVSCSKGLAKHHKGGNPVSGNAHEFQT